MPILTTTGASFDGQDYETLSEAIEQAQNKGDCIRVVVRDPQGRQDTSDPEEPYPPYYQANALMLPGGTLIIDTDNVFLPVA